MVIGWSLLPTLRRLSAGCLISLLLGCGAYDTRTQELSPADCNQISLSGPIAGVISIGEPRLELGVPQGQARFLTQAHEQPLQLAYKGTDQLQLTIVCRQLQQITLLGRAQLELQEPHNPVGLTKLAVYGDAQFAGPALVADGLEVRGAGHAQIALTGIEADELTVLLSGAARLAVANGTVARGDLQLTGSSQMAAEQLQHQWLQLQASGDSQAVVAASAHLGGRLRDAARVVYVGQPDLSIEQQDQTGLEAKHES